MRESDDDALNSIFKWDDQNTTITQTNGYSNLFFCQLDQLLVHFSLARSRRSKRVRVRVDFSKYTINLRIAVRTEIAYAPIHTCA